MENVKKNFAYQTAYQLLLIILPLITAPYIARTIGPNGVGEYSYTYSIVSYFALFAKLGIDVYGNRSIAIIRDDQDRLNQTFSDILLVHIAISTLVLLLYFLFLLTVHTVHKTVSYIQCFYVIAELVQVNWLFFGLEKFKITVIRNAIIKLITVLLIFLFVKDEDDVFIYCAILSISAALSEIVIWVYVPKYVSFVKPNFRMAIKHIAPMISFFIPSIAVSLYKVMDKIMLGSMTDSVVLGFYENSEKVTAIGLTVVTALGTVMMPRMANLASKGNKEESRKITGLTIKYVSILSIAMAFGIAAVSNVFAPVFYGERFSACSVLMMGLSISIPFTAFANVIRTQYLIPNHRDRVYQLSVISGAIVNLAINWTLIPRMAAMGAVIGTVVAESAVCIIQSFFSRKDLPISYYITRSTPYLFFGLSMSVIVNMIGRYMKNSIITLTMQVIIGIVIYIGMCLIYWRMTNDDLWTMFNNMLKRIKH